MTTQNEADGFALLDGLSIAEPSITYATTSEKAYHKLVRYQNVTSYSQLQELHRCPRRLQLLKYRANEDAGSEAAEDNINFSYGHSVGAGVQSIVTGTPLHIALFNGWMAWHAEFDARDIKGKKSIWEAAIAIEKFGILWEETLRHEWEIVLLPSGKPAIELTYSLDCGNGYKHYGHVDIVLRNRVTDEYAVFELKTTKYKSVDEATYANSSQGIGYSVALDAIFPGLSSYEVFYFIYSSGERTWIAMPFQKTTAQKTEWIRDTLLDHAMMDKYEELAFYPKRGENCYAFFRRCEFFGACNLVPEVKLPTLGMDEEVEAVDYAFSLAEIVKAQQNRLPG